MPYPAIRSPGTVPPPPEGPAEARDAADSRPTVVLLHSSASSARQWADLIAALEPRYRVRAVELHGHGQQARWHGAWRLTLADEAALVAPLLVRAGGAHVIGHSYGAAVGAKLATMYPDLVRSMVAYEPVLFRWLLQEDPQGRCARQVLAVADAIRSTIAVGRVASAAEIFVDFWCGLGTWEALPDHRRDPIAARMPAVLLHFEALVREPLACSELSRLDIPMLFMSGDQTVAPMRCIAGLLRRGLPRAQHEVFRGLGHMGPVTHPAEVNAGIARFLQQPARLDDAQESVALA